MPDARISELPAATSPADTDLTALVQTSGASLITNKATVAQLRGAVLDGRSAHVRDYGAKGDGTTNDAPAIQAAINDLATKGGGVLMFGAKTYRIASAITIGTVAVKLQGQGFVEGPSPGNGTWLKVDTTGFTPITFTGAAARGGGIADIAFFQAHTATQNASWAPTGYDYLIRIQDCLGGVDIHNVFLCSINKGIYCDNSGRLDIHRLRGQIFTTGVEVDDCFDVPRLRSIHFWPFSTSNTFVMAYSQANCDAMLFRRADGVFIDQAFVFGARSMFRFSGGTAGVTTKFYIGQAYADFVQYGVLVEGAGTDGLIDSLTTQGESFGSGGSPLAGAAGIRVSAPNCRLQIGKLRCDRVQDNAIRVEQYGNRLDIFALRCVNFNSQANGSAAIHIVDSGANAANVVYLGSPPLLEGVTGPLQNSSSNGVLATGTPPGSAARPGLAVGSTNTGLFLPASNTFAASAGGVEVMRATSIGGLTFGAAPSGHALEVATPVSTGNRVLITGAATGGGASIQAQGADANVTLLLADKGTGGIQASSNGGLTLKLDSAGANPVNFVGIRAGTGSTAGLVYGAGSGTNVDLQLGAQGSGLVRGITAPSADSSTALATTAWVRLQGYGTGSSAVSSVAGRTGAVTLAVADVSGAAPLTSAALVTPSLSGETYSYAAVTAGTNAQGQGAMTADISAITSTPNSPSGVTLPTATTGRALTVINRGTNPVQVYPASGTSIDGMAVNAPVPLAVNGMLEFYATSTTAWYSQVNIAVAASQVTGTLAVSQGGTGATTAGAALTALGAAPLASPVFTGNGVTLPTWTTAGRPSPATAGMIGWNTTLARFDICAVSGTPGTWKNDVRIDGDTITGALLANSGGGGNVARISGATTGNPVVIGLDASSVDPNPNVVLGNLRGGSALMAMPPDSAFILASAIVASGGTSGYVVGDVLTVSGGTTGGLFPAAATMKVSAVTAGVITAVTMLSQGSYNTVPGNPVSVTGGSGAGAPTFTATWQNNGAARGVNAVDWQTSRTAASQVASGATATISGGTGNIASGLQSTVVGGSGNTASGNQAVAGGNGVQATASWSTAFGRLTLADATASFATGFGARSHGIYGARVHGTTAITTNGDAQLGDYVLSGRSTAGAAVRLTADGAAAGAANIANIPNNTAWTGTLMVTARDQTTGDSGHWVFAYFAINRKASASTIATATSGATFTGALAGTTGLATTALTFGVDSTNGGLNLTFTPPNTDTWDVVAVYRTAEVQ